MCVLRARDPDLITRIREAEVVDREGKMSLVSCVLVGIRVRYEWSKKAMLRGANMIRPVESKEALE